MRKDYKLKKGNGFSFASAKDIGNYIYVLRPFGAYSLDDDYFNDAIIGKAPINNPTKIEIVDVLKKQNQYYCYLSSFYDLLICDSGSIHIYNTKTNQKIYTIENCVDYEGNTECMTIIYKNSTDKKMVLVIDQNYNEYNFEIQVSYFRSFNVYNNYVIFYNHVDNKIFVYDYKTGIKLEDDQSNIIYNEYKNSLDTPSNIQEENNFIYKGQNYTWEKEVITEEVLTNEKNDNGEYITKKVFHVNVIINNLNTKQSYKLTNEEFNIQANTVLQALNNAPITCQAIFSVNDELYFCYYYSEDFFGVISGDTTPSIVFKYDEQTNKLVYIGYGEEPSYVPQVFKGNIINN